MNHAKPWQAIISSKLDGKIICTICAITKAERDRQVAQFNKSYSVGMLYTVQKFYMKG